MNLETGQMGHLADVLRDAKPGERVIPATIIGRPGKYANKQGRRRALSTVVPMVVSEKQAAPVYGPRKPLREVRAELQALKAAEAA